jgi:thiosulfate/3-mercaptopyruvate sulfurtransferase
MIDTYFGLDRLGSPQAMFAALLIGALFGLVLERAGFGSSRRLAGIFYFRDMAVVKVMFSALVTAMIGLSYLTSLGWLRFDQLFMMPTVYGAQIVGGLLFGVGFVMSGWCPGTGVVGLASGRMDAFVFLLGSVAGAILFNELFTPIAPLASWGESGVRFVHESLGMSRAAFALLLTLAAVGSFWGAEAIERARHGAGPYWNSPFLRAFSVAMVALAAGLFLFPNTPPDAAATAASGPAATGADASAEDAERALWRIMGTGEDHMDPAELADRLVHGDPHLVLVDVRSEEEFDRFHIRGAIHVPIDQLDRQLRAHKNRGIIVLYSNGMTHPAQARDSLFRLGYGNVYILTDGLQGFLERCLKPASLRAEPIAAEMAARIQEWRHFFHASAQSPAAPGRDIPLPVGVHLPGLMSTEWLATNLGRKGLRIIDLRTQPDYNTGHVP